MSHLLLYFLYTQRHEQKAWGSRLMSHSILILFTHVAPHTKSKGLPIDVLFYSYTFYMSSATYNKQGLLINVPFYSYIFYMCNTEYKKQGAPD
jgi:hypothetical protein